MRNFSEFSNHLNPCSSNRNKLAFLHILFDLNPQLWIQFFNPFELLSLGINFPGREKLPENIQKRILGDVRIYAIAWTNFSHIYALFLRMAITKLYSHFILTKISIITSVNVTMTNSRNNVLRFTVSFSKKFLSNFPTLGPGLPTFKLKNIHHLIRSSKRLRSPNRIFR
jgi:hypothetical protein